jgi:hypothetical protein
MFDDQAVDIETVAQGQIPRVRSSDLSGVGSRVLPAGSEEQTDCNAEKKATEVGHVARRIGG